MKVGSPFKVCSLEIYFSNEFCATEVTPRRKTLSY